MHGEQRHAVILSGAGRYSDPWHPFPDTSARMAAVLQGAGLAVEIIEQVDERLRDLSGTDLLVVNVGDPDGMDPADRASRAGLLSYLVHGGPVLAMHVSSTSFPAIPEWEAIVGGVWVRGTTMHPDLGRSRIRIYPTRHVIVAPLNDFEIVDERYSFLRTASEVVPLATHMHDGVEHPLLWAHHYGPAPVVYDALGHDARSFDSTEHCEIVRRSALWLVGEL